ncbi:putative MFS family arabinose efflux permease [Novosphingobium kunmingense]|uniref:Putative MFS family arabinose efflux permease n=1 Tax=Novosphingobium kunmingense TaxID=1211806 RepID=A0A2N0I190_9SPHN|nr:MFS transporter [Novosphingobium kunmingense]PKB24952.1 putative MFS family arabinose efflux permease [Novosphingobium kunmingense]
MNPLRQHRRVLTASLTGTAVEFYDFYVFATATALVFGELFFPKSSPEVQGIAKFMVFGLAFIARPIGAVAFGHFGDRVGRKATLVASLLLMGASTLLVAFLPGYADAGFFAPLLLCILRFGQGLGLGGEWGGAALLATENAPKGWESRFGAAPQLGAPLGFLAANGLFLLLGLWLSDADFLNWGWRVPFLASAVLVGIGLWVRLNIGETAQFREALDRAPPPAVPLWALLRDHGGAVLAGSAGVVACFALFYLSTAFALDIGTRQLGYPRETFLSLQLAANLFLALGIVIAAWLSDRTSAGRMILWGAVATIGVGLLFAPGLAGGTLAIFLTLATALFVMGFVYGPLGGWLTTLYPVPVRYSGVSVAFNAGGIVGGAVTPLVAKAMTDAGHGDAIGYLLVAAGALTVLGVSLARPAPAAG